MTTAAEYRRYARECLHAMPLSTSLEIKLVLATMAERWNKLADNAERNAAPAARPAGQLQQVSLGGRGVVDSFNANLAQPHGIALALECRADNPPGDHFHEGIVADA